MKKLLNFHPQNQMTIPEATSFLKNQYKKKKKFQQIKKVKKQSISQLNITPSILKKERNPQTCHTANYSPPPVSEKGIEKHENYLRKNDGMVSKQNFMNQKLFRQRFERKIQLENMKKKNDEIVKFMFLKKKTQQCDPLCGLFKVKCPHCKPDLDCFNERFEAFLRENNLWILKEPHGKEEQLKKYILNQIIDFYKQKEVEFEKNKNNSEFSQINGRESIKQKIIRRLPNFKFGKTKERQIINWFQKIFGFFRKEFFTKKQKNRNTMYNTSNRKGKNAYYNIASSKNQKGVNSLHVKLQHRRNSTNNGFHGKNEKDSEHEKEHREIGSGQIKGRRQSILKVNENMLDKLKKDKSGFKLFDRELGKTKGKNKTYNYEKNNMYLEDEEEGQRRKQSKEFNKKMKGKKKTMFIGEQSSEEQLSSSATDTDEQLSDDSESFEPKTKRRRRKGLLQKVNLLPEDSELRFLKNKINSARLMMEKVEKYLEEQGFEELKVKQTDCVLTLSRKQRYLKLFQPFQLEIEKDFKAYMKMIKTQIQKKLNKTTSQNQETHVKDDIVEVVESEDGFIKKDDVCKSLSFYDLFEASPNSVEFYTLSNENYVKGLYRDYYLDHQTSEKKTMKIKIPSYLLVEEENEDKKDEQDVLCQMDMGQKGVESKRSMSEGI